MGTSLKNARFRGILRSEPRRFRVSSTSVVVGVKNYPTRRDSAYNRRQFRTFLEDRPHIRITKRQYRDPKTGEFMEYIDGQPCLVPASVHEIGGLQFFQLGGVTESDLRFLQSRMGQLGWVDSIEEIPSAHIVAGQTKKPGSHRSTR